MSEDGTNNTRKRGNDDGNINQAPQKRSYFGLTSSDGDSVYLKFLVPQATAGSVIGKGGSNISELQKEFNIHIRMSKANDIFPGTDSRVALMSGHVTSVLAATVAIFKRMTSPSDLFPKTPRPKSISDKEISLIVPQSTAGLIIGKGGGRVKSIQEEANCHINLTQKSDQLPSNERVVTIQNNNSSIEHIEIALKLILDIIKSDPASGSCLMINYSNFEPEYRDNMHRDSRRNDYHDEYYDEPPPRQHWEKGSGRGGEMNMNSSSHGIDLAPSVAAGGANGGGVFSATSFPSQVHFWCTFSGPPIANGHTPPPHMLDGMKAHLLNVGYPLKTAQEIIAASNILASYGVLKPGNIAIFNTTQLQQATNPFNQITENGIPSGMGVGGNSAWNNNAPGNKFQHSGGGFNRGYDGGHGMGQGGGGYRKNDMHEIKRRY